MRLWPPRRPSLLSSWENVPTTRYRCILLIYIRLQDRWRECLGSPFLAEKTLENCRWGCKFSDLPSARPAFCNWLTVSNRLAALQFDRPSIVYLTHRLTTRIGRIRPPFRQA